MLRRRMVVSNAATNLQNFFGITANRREIVRAETSAHRDQPIAFATTTIPKVCRSWVLAFSYLATLLLVLHLPPPSAVGKEQDRGHITMRRLYCGNNMTIDRRKTAVFATPGQPGCKYAKNGCFYNHLTTTTLYKNNSFLPPPRLRSHCDRYAMAWRQIPNRRA